MFRPFLLLLIPLLVAALPVAAPAAELADAPCYECHDELQETFAAGTPHPPVEEGDCEACHEDHGDEETLMLSDEVPGLCFGCHDEFEGAHQHDPVGEGDCLGCHNPHHSTQSSLLADEVPALCFECHDEFEGAHQHDPVSDGDCMGCHSPHDSAQSSLLTDAVPALCFGCHDEFDKAHQHDPVSEGDCMGCHGPHDSAQASLLQDAMPGLCYECHDDYSEGLSVHEPVAEGSCAECHDPHHSERAVLLTSRYDSKLRVVFSADAYELCFNCHDLDAFTDPVTDDATEFRYGARNLHYVHLLDEDRDRTKKKYSLIKKKRKPSTSCSGCHLPHSADQAKLIRPERERGEVTVFTISFREAEGGGGCVVGCHKPYKYERGERKGKPVELSTPRSSKGPGF